VPVVVVNQSGSAVDLRPIAQDASAIVHASLPGQAGGGAIARILFGQTNPSGKLTETFPLELEHNPSHLSYPGSLDRVEYAEGIFVGYRHYDTRKLPVQYPFGYGLSYTSFAYSDINLSARELEPELGLTVTFSVANTGDRAGKEIAQVYVRDTECSVARPLRELKGFASVALEPGETRSVSVTLDARAFALYSEHLGRFAVEPGEFVIEVGASSRDIRLSQAVNVRSADEIRPPLTRRNELAEFIDDDRYASFVRPAWEAAVEASRNNEFLESVKHMPVRLVLGFLPEFGVAEEAVAGLDRAVSEAMAGQDL
jgi:beta-glucosidase